MAKDARKEVRMEGWSEEQLFSTIGDTITSHCVIPIHVAKGKEAKRETHTHRQREKQTDFLMFSHVQY